MTYRVLCYGGRDFSDAVKVHAALSLLEETWGASFLIINGGARGADTLCAEWNLRQGRPVITMPAPWSALGKAAGHARNKWMVQYALPNYAVAFPGGAGTRNMTEQLRLTPMPVWEPYP